MKIGDKVVCINDSIFPGFQNWGGDVPRVGAIYTIRGWYCEEPYGLCLLLVEIRNRNIDGYRAIRFVPLIEQGSEVHATQTRTDDGENPNPNFVGETLVQKEKMEQFKI